MKYVVLGSSAAGINGVRELRRLDKTAEITMISKDKDIYSRCVLHKYLGGQRTLKEIGFVEDNFDTLYNVRRMGGKACVGVNRKEKTVQLEDGSSVPYDKLLIATGSDGFMPPIKHLAAAKNKTAFRNASDVDALKEAAKTCKNIVILGAGLVGVDCAEGLVHLGVKPTLIDAEHWILNKQLDKKAATAYMDAFAAKGVKQLYNVMVSEVVLDSNDLIREIVLSSGEKIPCDYLVVTIGIHANVDFLKDSGLELNDHGLVFDPQGRTNDPNIFGAGDVSGTHPIWPVAVKEGLIAAGTMTGADCSMTDFFASKSTMNFFGIPSMSLGDVNLQDGNVSVETMENGQSYKKILHRNGKILGALMQGDLSYGGILQQLIANKIDVSKVKKSLFNIDYADFFHIDEQFEFYYEQ